MPDNLLSTKPPVGLDDDYRADELTPEELYHERLIAFEWALTKRDPSKADQVQAKDTWGHFKAAFFQHSLAQAPKELDQMAETLLAELRVKRARYLGTAPDSGDDSGDEPVDDGGDVDVKDPGDELAELELKLVAVQRLRADKQAELMLQALKLHANYTLDELIAKGGPLDTMTTEVEELKELVGLGSLALTACARAEQDAALRLARATAQLSSFEGKIGQGSVVWGERVAKHQPIVDALTERVEALETALAKAERALEDNALDATALSGYHAARQELAKARKKLNDERIELVRAENQFAFCLKQIQSVCVPWIYNPRCDPEHNPVDREFKEAVRAYEAAGDSRERLSAEVNRNKERLQLSEAKRQDLMSRRIVAQELQTLLAAGAALTQAFKANAWLGEIKIWAVGAEALQARFATEEPVGVTYDSFAKLAGAFSRAHEQLRRNGFTLDQSKELFDNQLKDWPESWLPPEMRAQEQNWIKVKALFEEQKAQKGRSNLEVFGDAALESAKTYQQTVLTSVGVAIDDSVAGQVTRGALTFVALCIDIATAGKALRDREEKAESVQDPVQALMVVEDRMTLAVKCLEMGSKNVTAALRAMPWDKIAAAAPGVGSLQKLTEGLHQAHQAAQRWQAAAADAEVHAKALRTAHSAETALDHVASRASKLAKRDTAYAATTFLALAGYVCECAGLSAPVGIIIRASAGLSSGLLATGFTLEDMVHAEAAKKTLRAAQAGDADARAEIFRHHARYATALLAMLAQEGDPVAISLYSNHKVTKSMIERSSALVLKRYLMQELQETDAPTSISDVLTGIVRTAEGIKLALGAAKRVIEDKLHPLTRVDLKDLSVDRLPIVGASSREVRKAVSRIRALRRDMVKVDERIKGKPHLSPAVNKHLRTAQDLYMEATDALRAQEEISLNAVDDIAATMRTLETLASTFADKDLLGKTRARYTALLQEQRDILRQVDAALSAGLVSEHLGLRAV